MHKQFILLFLLTLMLTSVNAAVNIDSFTINSSANYTNDSNLELGINVSGGTGYQAKFSCNNSTWTDYATFTSTMYFDINTASYGCSVTSGLKNIYVDVNFTDANIDTADNNIIFDAINPSTTSFSPTSSVTGDGANGQAIVIGTSDDTNLSSISLTLLRGSTTIYDSNSTACTITGTSSNCSFTELNIDRGGSYTYNYIITDMAGNTASDSNSFTFTDSTALSAPPAPIVNDRNNNIDLNWAANTTNDFNRFSVYRSTQTGFDCNSETFVSNTDNNYYSDNGLDENTTYYYKLKAIDLTANTSVCSDQNYATTDYNLNTGPTITRTDVSCDSNSWCYQNDPEFTITQTNSEFSWILTTSSTTDPVDCTYASDCNTTPASFSDVDNGTYYLRVKGCKPNGCGTISQYIVKVDNTSPPQPTPTATNVSSKVKLTWEAVTDTGGSGLNKYYIYSSTSSSFAGNSLSLLTSVDDSNLEYTDDTVQQGQTYYYKVRARDNAGNYSSDTNAPIASITTPTNLDNITLTTSIKNSNDVETIYFSTAEDFSLTLTFSDEVDDFYLYQTIDDETTETIIDSNDDITTYTHLFTTSANYTDINFYILASSLVNEINKEIHIYLDNTIPEISFSNVVANQIFTTNASIEINATDDHEIEKVELFFDDINLGNATLTNDIWKYDLVVNENKTGSLKATVTDKSGLTANVTQTITLTITPEIIDTNTDSNNLVAEITIETIIAKINEVIAQQNIIDEKILSGLVLSETQQILQTEANALIAEAEILLDSDLDLANSKALEAHGKYAQILDETNPSFLSIIPGDFTIMIILVTIIIIIAGAGGIIVVLNKQGKLNFGETKDIPHAHNKHNLEIDDDVNTKNSAKKPIKLKKSKENLPTDDEIPEFIPKE
jgi:hypothetical protein